MMRVRVRWAGEGIDETDALIEIQNKQKRLVTDRFNFLCFFLV